MKYRPRASLKALGLALLMPAFAFSPALSSNAAAADKEIVIFNAKDKFRPNWTVEVWGGMRAKVNDAGDKSTVDAFLSDESKPWSGITLQVGYSSDAKMESIPLTEELRTKGVVVLSLNAGKNLEATETGDLQLQLSLSFVMNDGKIVDVGFGKAAQPVRLDGDPATWEKVQIPIADILKQLPDPSQAAGLSRVGIQWVDTPKYGLSVSEVVVKTE